MTDLTRNIESILPNGKIILIQAVSSGGQEYVTSKNAVKSFHEVTDAVEGIAQSIEETIKKVKPKRASVEFGLQVAIESGKLTALLVQGSGVANLKIILEWGEQAGLS